MLPRTLTLPIVGVVTTELEHDVRSARVFRHVQLLDRAIERARAVRIRAAAIGQRDPAVAAAVAVQIARGRGSRCTMSKRGCRNVPPPNTPPPTRFGTEVLRDVGVLPVALVEEVRLTVVLDGPRAAAPNPSCRWSSSPADRDRPCAHRRAANRASRHRCGCPRRYARRVLRRCCLPRAPSTTRGTSSADRSSRPPSSRSPWAGVNVNVGLPPLMSRSRSVAVLLLALLSKLTTDESMYWTSKLRPTRSLTSQRRLSESPRSCWSASRSACRR